MSDIVLSMQSGEPVASSRQIADNFEKRHDHVMRDIDAMKKDVPNFGEMFFETTAPDSYGREQRTYLMNRDGFTLLAILSDYFDTWVSKCVCLCRATSRDVPAFIVKKVGECWQ